MTIFFVKRCRANLLKPMIYLRKRLIFEGKRLRNFLFFLLLKFFEMIFLNSYLIFFLFYR